LVAWSPRQKYDHISTKIKTCVWRFRYHHDRNAKRLFDLGVLIAINPAVRAVPAGLSETGLSEKELLTSIRHQSPHAPPMTCGNDRSGLRLIGARLFVMFPQVRGSTWQEPAPGMNN
jgi:hypothetical protein